MDYNIANQLAVASQLFGMQDCTLYLYEGNVIQNGLVVPQYSEPVKTKCIAQPENIDSLKSLGFDTTKVVYRFYILLEANIVNGVTEDGASRVRYQGKDYVIQSKRDWLYLNGWVRTLGTLQDTGAI